MIIHLVENDSLMRTKVTQTQQAKKEEMSVDVYKKAEEVLDWNYLWLVASVAVGNLNACIQISKIDIDTQDGVGRSGSHHFMRINSFLSLLLLFFYMLIYAMIYIAHYPSLFPSFHVQTHTHFYDIKMAGAAGPLLPYGQE